MAEVPLNDSDPNRCTESTTFEQLKKRTSIRLANNVDLEVQARNAVKVTIIYVTAVILVAILTFVGQYEIHSTLHVHESDGARINIGGRQRMLSQKLTMETFASALGFAHQNQSIGDRFKAMSQATFGLLTISKQYLLYGNKSLKLIPETNGSIVALYDAIEAPMQSLAVSRNNILGNSSLERHILNDDSIANEMFAMVAKSAQFLQEMNAIVFEYQYISDARINNLVIIEGCFLAITVIALLAEGIFVVRPLIKQLIRITKEVQKEGNPPERVLAMRKAKRATLIYVISFASVGIATIVGMSLVQSTLAAHAEDSSKINISGRQRMLSQKLTMETMTSLLGNTRNNQTLSVKYANATTASVRLWTLSHDALIFGNRSLGLSQETNATLLSMHSELDVHYLKMKTLVDSLLGSRNVLSNATVREIMFDLIGTSATFLAQMNAITGQYQTNSDTRIDQLLLIEIVILSFTAVVFAVEILFVVRPSIMRAIELRKDLKHRRSSVEASRKSTKTEKNDASEPSKILNSGEV